MGAVVGSKEQGAVHVGQILGIRIARAGVDVLDHEGAGGGAVALPQFKPVRPVIRLKEQCAVDIGEPRSLLGAPTRKDVFDEEGPGGSPVALPQLACLGAVKGCEKQRAVYVLQVVR